MNAISLHIGLDSVNPEGYAGWSGKLQSCEKDALDMQKIAASLGYTTLTVMTKDATVIGVTGTLLTLAGRLKSRDMLFLSYSGHGGQVPDKNGDEIDRTDETWCLYDRMMIDDEIYALLSKFRKGVRIFVLSDSCHSGTVMRSPTSDPPVGRIVPPVDNLTIYTIHSNMYDSIQGNIRPKSRSVVKMAASIIFISACQDHQLASDGPDNGLFTATLKRVWDNGNFTGNYRRFRDVIASKMPLWQTPGYAEFGATSKFRIQTPFIP